MKASVVLTLYQTISRNLPSVLKLHFSVTVSPTTTGGKGSIVTVKYPAEQNKVRLIQCSDTCTHLYRCPDGSGVIQSWVYLTDRVYNLFKSTHSQSCCMLLMCNVKLFLLITESHFSWTNHRCTLLVHTNNILINKTWSFWTHLLNTQLAFFFILLDTFAHVHFIQ